MRWVNKVMGWLGLLPEKSVGFVRVPAGEGRTWLVRVESYRR